MAKSNKDPRKQTITIVGQDIHGNDVERAITIWIGKPSKPLPLTDAAKNVRGIRKWFRWRD